MANETLLPVRITAVLGTSEYLRFTGAECPLWGYGCYRRVSGKALPTSRFCMVDRKNMPQPPQKVCNQLEKSLQEVARLRRRLERIERMRVRVIGTYSRGCRY